MATNNGIITAPVTVKEVADLLNSSGSGASAKYDVGSVCTSGRINKWSKHKPVVSNVTFGDRAEQHWRQYNVNDATPRYYGLRITGITPDSHDAFNNDAYKMYNDETPNNYEYDKPVGASINAQGVVVGSPFRLGDFEGYRHYGDPLCTSNLVKGTEIEIPIGSDTQEIESVRFYVDGNRIEGSLGFNDFKNTFVSGAYFVLCANVYEKTQHRWLGEYIGNNIKIGDGDQPTSIDEDYYNDYRYKYVDVIFDKSKYWGASVQSVEVYLTLDWVTYDSSQDVWSSEKKIIIPYTDQHYYKTSYKFTVFDRQCQLSEIQIAYLDATAPWGKVGTPIPSNLSSLFLSPFLHFKISRTYTALRFYTGQDRRGSYIKTVFRKGNGTSITKYGYTTTATKTNMPEYIDVPAAQNTSQFSTMDDLYVQVDNIFGDDDISHFSRNVSYTVEVYLGDASGNETKIGTFPLSYS